MAELLRFPPEAATALEPYLQDAPTTRPPSRPRLTLTFATSLDSAIALRPGTQTALSGPGSKAMTHHLRSRHAAILVGAGTAVADDPKLNCRIAGSASRCQPRPVVLDPRARWALSEQSRVVRLAAAGEGLAPFVVVAPAAEVDARRRAVLERVGGKYVVLEERRRGQDDDDDDSGGGGGGGGGGGRFAWEDVLALLAREGLDSVMVEGGGAVINALLAPENVALVDAVVVTIAPTWLGKGGVVVSPDRPGGESGSEPAARLGDVKWLPLGEDVVLCGRPVVR